MQEGDKKKVFNNAAERRGVLVSCDCCDKLPQMR